MTKIKTRRHGLLDYMTGGLLMLPWITNFNASQQDTWILGAVGFLVIFYSVFTDYELGFIKLIPMRVHLVLDVLVALFLIASPFFLPIYHYYFYWPMGLGVLSLIAVFVSSATPYQVSKQDLNITQP
jgi:hypothetical protein